MSITELSKLGTIHPILGLLLLGMLTGCPATLPKVETKYIVQPCVNASVVPSEPMYSFDELTQPSNPKEEASAVVALYEDYLNARAYSDTLRYLITPCLGVKDENQSTK